MSGSEIAVARRPLALGFVAAGCAGEAALLDADCTHHRVGTLSLERERCIACGAGIEIAPGFSVALQRRKARLQGGDLPRQFAQGAPLRDRIQEFEDV